MTLVVDKAFHQRATRARLDQRIIDYMQNMEAAS